MRQDDTSRSRTQVETQLMVNEVNKAWRSKDWETFDRLLAKNLKLRYNGERWSMEESNEA